MRRALMGLEAQVARRMQTATERLAANKISLRAWQAEMKAQIKEATLVSTALAVGGRREVATYELRRIQKDAARQFKRLQRWASQIERGKASPSAARAGMYARQSTNMTYQNERKDILGDRMLVVWVRTARESCAGCIAQSEFDPRPESEVPPLGSQDCLSNCRCYYQFVPAA